MAISQDHDVVVIGSGIAGVTAAYFLVQKGFHVTVMDRQRHAAMETSYANGGQISVCNAEVWTRPKTIWQGIKWMLDSDAPLLMNPMPSLSKYRWMTSFMAAAFGGKYLPNTLKTIEMGLRSRQNMRAMMQDVQLD
ncbi:MAG: FAD-dependent oxidoreductase, partial [Alphaproteobacteria bacterium]